MQSTFQIDDFNKSQAEIFRDAIVWYNTVHGSNSTFEISGPPGSGKSWLIDKIVRALNINPSRVAPMAYTGSAVINMRTKGMYNARTIFSWLYDFIEVPELDVNGKPVLDPVFNKPKYRMRFIPKTNLPGIDLIIVDECGMVPEDMRHVIDSMGIPVIAAGDIDQLPPVVGHSGYLTDPSTIHYLNEIMRQAAGNTIIQFSQMLIRGIPIPYGHHGNVTVMYEDELSDDMIAHSDIMICGKNVTRDALNNHVRQDMFGYTAPVPNMGERVVCRKNNWNVESNGINLTNGLVGSCVSMITPSSFNTEDKTFKMWFKPDKIDALFQDVDVDYFYMVSDKKTRDSIMQTHHSSGNKFEYGYAITTHMSQGSEFNNGIYFEEYINQSINRNLHYVGITRFRNHCIYVKKRPKKYW